MKFRSRIRGHFFGSTWALMLWLSAAAATFSACGTSEQAACGNEPAPCAQGRVCVDGACRELCSRDEDCEAGMLCDGHTCVQGWCAIDGLEVSVDALNPLNPCESCNPRTSTTAYSARADGAQCDDNLFCTTPGTCSDGQCQPGPAPCTAEQPFCSEANDVCVCDPTSCDNGLYCDGAEFCAATGECGAGAAPVCTGLTPICSNVAAACVECASNADCGGSNPSCVDYICTACPTCPCPSGEHDGGDGACVLVGTCSVGYTLAYPDLDADGVTDVALDACLAVLPAGHQAEPQGPPQSSMAVGAAQSLADGGRDWESQSGISLPDFDEARCRNVRSTDPSNRLVASSLGLSVPAQATITGVRVHILRRQEPMAPALKDLSVQLVVGGNSAGDDRADDATLWTDALIEATYGGADDLWGLALTPGDVNDAGFGVALSVTSTETSSIDAFVDYVWVDVFYRDGVNEALADCDDDLPTQWLATTGYVDADGDGYTVGPPGPFCVGIAGGVVDPTDFATSSLGDDCYDANAAAHPGQLSCFATHRGDGSFDYDCDDAPTKCNTNLATGCSCTATCAVSSTTTITPAAACGVTNSNWTACSPAGAVCPSACDLVSTATFVTRCR